MTGMVGIPSSGQARSSRFYADLLALRTPPNTKVVWHEGPYVPINRNHLCRQALEHEADWLLMIDDDHAFHPDLLERLLAVDAPVVVPLCLTKVPPYQPVLYEGRDQDGHWIPYTVDELPDDVLRVEAAGTGCMLIRTMVLEAIPEPWFEMTRNGLSLVGEDLAFSQKLVDAAIPLLADCTTTIGHQGGLIVWPDTSGAKLELGDGRELRLEITPIPA